MDTLLKNNIEGIILKWAYQTDEVLTKASDEELKKGNNPGPMTEIKFWDAKCMNLESLFEQMKADLTKKMASILNVTDSAYYPCFKSMFRSVVAALNEALDITMHLKPLTEHFLALENAEFSDVRPLFSPLMHALCLVYCNSEYYSTTARVIILGQEICNLLVEMARKFLDPTSIFQIEVEEGLDKVKLSIRNLKEFKTCFQEYKTALPSYFTDQGKPAKTWEGVQEPLVFTRYDSFVTRLEVMMEFFNTAVQFLKLEKVEIGGIRGKALTSNINKVYEEFRDLYSVFSMRTYDALDPMDKGFIKDYQKFNEKVFALDRKLGAILSRAFDDCIISESIFKLLHIFGTLVERRLIAMELSDKMPMLLEMLNNELEGAKEVFEQQETRVKDQGKALMDRNMPPVSGQICFSVELRCVEHCMLLSD